MSGGFWNMMRESTDTRLIDEQPMQGWVVDNNDKNKVNPDGSNGPGGNQQIKVRIYVLHDEIADADLPWFSPNQLSSSSGAASIGDHGPIPPIGTKVWVHFNDPSQYHGIYGGGVANVSTQIPEFVAGAGSAGSSGSGGDDSLSEGMKFSTESSSSSGTPVYLPLNIPWDFSTNYPNSYGGIDLTGSFDGNDNTADIQTHSLHHVTATMSYVDGKGNWAGQISGDTPRPDNPNAKKIFPTGGTLAVFGDCTLYVSGNLSISVDGDCSLAVKGNFTVGVKGNTDLECSGTITINSSQINLNNASPSPISSTAIAKAPARTRPVPVAPSGDVYPTMSGGGGPAGSAGNTVQID
jgi:hypothetical protein